MGPPPDSLLNGLTPGMQFAVNLAIFLVTIFGAATAYFSQKKIIKKEGGEAYRVVSDNPTDTRAFQELLDYLKSIDEHSEKTASNTEKLVGISLRMDTRLSDAARESEILKHAKELAQEIVKGSTPKRRGSRS